MKKKTQEKIEKIVVSLLILGLLTVNIMFGISNLRLKDENMINLYIMESMGEMYCRMEDTTLENFTVVVDQHLQKISVDIICYEPGEDEYNYNYTNPITGPYDYVGVLH